LAILGFKLSTSRTRGMRINRLAVGRV